MSIKDNSYEEIAEVKTGTFKVNQDNLIMIGMYSNHLNQILTISSIIILLYTHFQPSKRKQKNKLFKGILILISQYKHIKQSQAETKIPSELAQYK